MPSREGRCKAFSTCLPHLIVVTVSPFWVFCLFESFTQISITLGLASFCLLYHAATHHEPPHLSLRNKDMKVALGN